LGKTGISLPGLFSLPAGLNEIREMDVHSHADAAAPLIGHNISSI
jgi:hypothetical protein